MKNRFMPTPLISLDRFFEDWPFTDTWTYRGTFIDTDKYDIVPKESYKKELIKRKEEELKQEQDRTQLRQEQLQRELTELRG